MRDILSEGVQCMHGADCFEIAIEPVYMNCAMVAVCNLLSQQRLESSCKASCHCPAFQGGESIRCTH